MNLLRKCLKLVIGEITLEKFDYNNKVAIITGKPSPLRGGDSPVRGNVATRQKGSCFGKKGVCVADG